MATLRCHCVREARALAFRSSTLAHRARYIHSAISLRDDSSSRMSDDSQPPAAVPLENQANFNAIKNVQRTSNSVPRSRPLVRFMSANEDGNPQTTYSRPIRAEGSGDAKAPMAETLGNQASSNSTNTRETSHSAPRARPLVRFSRPGEDGKSETTFTRPAGTESIADARNLRASTGGAQRFAVRRPQSAQGASSQGSRPRKEFGGIQASRGPRGPRTLGATSSRGKKKGSGTRGRTRFGDDTSTQSREPVYTYNDFKTGLPVPSSLQLSDTAIEYLAQKAEREALGVVYVPELKEASLAGHEASTISATRDSAGLVHRYLNRMASTTNPTNLTFPSEKALQLLHGQTVYFHSEEEAKAAQDSIKAMRLADLTKDIEKRGPDEQLPERASHDLASYKDIELKTVPEADRAAVQGAWLAGRYVAPGEGAGKNASDILRSVWKQTARNETYLTTDEKSFARKVASMVPSRVAPAAAKGKAPAKPQQRASA